MINWDWEARKPHGLSKRFKNREMLWLWCRLEANSYELDPNKVNDVESRANHLIDSIADRETVGSLRRYENECFSNRLDESEFKWIDYKDQRLVFWLLEMIGGGFLAVTPALTRFDQSVLRPYERIELAFDSSDISLDEKKKVLSNLHRAWSTLIEVDPSLDWIDKKDESQCRWLVDEVKGGDLAPWISTELGFPVNNEERLLLVLNALDRSGFPVNLNKLFLDELKKKWKRRNNKSDSDKVQCNLNVNALTKEYIKKLADSDNKTMGELIDNLVSEEVRRRG